MPPPQAIRSAGPVTERCTAMAMVAAVSTVAVAIRSGSGSRGLPEARDEFHAVLLAAGALGRLAAVVGVAQQLVEQRPVDVSRCGDSAAAIAVQFAAGELARERIDHHVAGAGIEGDDIFGRAPAGITVMLAMPPMLSATRVRRGWRKSR